MRLRLGKPPETKPKLSVPALVTQLKEADQDFEWYPTTDQIIGALVKDLRAMHYHRSDYGNRYREYETLLDVGAGDGRTLRKIRDYLNRVDDDKHFRKLYAIEKSQVLIERMESDIFIVGTDFMEQTLLNKEANVMFSNPPYSTFVEWTNKLIRECAAPLLYLVIPVRWQESQVIKDALEFRTGDSKVLGEFSFENAERQARAQVHLIRVTFESARSNAFARFFDEEFAELKARWESKNAGKEDEEVSAKPNRDQFADLVVGESYPVVMVNMYNGDMAKVQRNYQLASELDVDLMREFEITPARIMEGLKNRMTGLRTLYWHELFSRLTAVTDRLTNKNRNGLLGTVRERVYVDFTVSNIHAVILWIIKNSAGYLDSQLVETYMRMIEKANVKNYKSNQKVYEWNRWRYGDAKPTHVYLDFRLVLERIGGLSNYYGTGYKMAETAAEFLGDTLTVARNLGFQCKTDDQRAVANWRDVWTTGKPEEFWCTYLGQRIVLMEVRAFKNGNLHIRLHQKFAAALNVEMGRLQGWLASKEQAESELGIEAKEAAKFFGSQFQLPTTSRLLLAA